MAQTAMRDMRGRPLRCEYCQRVLYLTDFQRGMAESTQVFYETLSGVCERDKYSHTYDCESAKRRSVVPAPGAEEGSNE